jgi:hypothetical protein
METMANYIDFVQLQVRFHLTSSLVVQALYLQIGIPFDFESSYAYMSYLWIFGTSTIMKSVHR